MFPIRLGSNEMKDPLKYAEMTVLNWDLLFFAIFRVNLEKMGETIENSF